jgi:3'(2'), 5'-bisphosphate nucleotidase
LVDRAHLVAAMLAAAQAAAQIIVVIRARGARAQRKADGSPLTDADQAAEALILQQLGAAFPDLPIVSEENAQSHALAPPAAFLLVDPIDGTKEFVAGRDEFTVNIALIEQGVPTLGVIVVPVGGDQYWVDAEGRAWQNRAGVCSILDGMASGAEEPARQGLVAAVSRSHPDGETDCYLAGFPVSHRMICGSSLKFCLIARGDADLYPRFGPTNEWDIAAGDAIVRAARGDVITPDGALFRYGKPGFRNGPYIARSDKARRRGQP